MTVETLNQLFETELEDMHSAETQLVDALEKLENETSSGEIQKEFHEHKVETREHVDRLEQIFESMGKSPGGKTCEGMQGIITEADSFGQKEPSAEIRDVYNLVAGEKAERYEITSYEGLIQMAEVLGMSEAVELLNANLDDEQEQLERLETMVREYNMAGLAAES